MLTKFMNEKFLLRTKTARELYGYAEKMPIIDYHCHVSPREIYEDRHFNNISEVWLGGDHYKWRLMRISGVDEKYITGDASDKEKFFAFAKILPMALGNPMYHWCHLELKRYFGYEGTLSEKTAEEVWQTANKKLQSGLGARELIKRSNVEFIGTTDDPADTLEWHEKLRSDNSFDVTVAPSFRPDRALDIEKDGWCEYISRLSEACGFEVDSVQSLKRALSARLDKFEVLGCRASDHGLSKLVFKRAEESETEAIFKKRMSGEALSPEETEGFKTELLLFCASEYKKRGIVMQVHYNCLRNPNTEMLGRFGPDSGFDCIGTDALGREKLALLLDAIKRESGLPKMIVYSLDGGDNAYIASLLGSFADGEAGKLQHGSAWWFNDSKKGMTEQITTLASLSSLGNFVGMLTDSRSFLSYTRHEYFRRILCDIIGEWAENGEYPNDTEALKTMVEGISYRNAKKYFSL